MLGYWGLELIALKKYISKHACIIYSYWGLELIALKKYIYQSMRALFVNMNNESRQNTNLLNVLVFVY